MKPENFIRLHKREKFVLASEQKMGQKVNLQVFFLREFRLIGIDFKNQWRSTLELLQLSDSLDIKIVKIRIVLYYIVAT